MIRATPTPPVHLLIVIINFFEDKGFRPHDHCIFFVFVCIQKKRYPRLLLFSPPSPSLFLPSLPFLHLCCVAWMNMK